MSKKISVPKVLGVILAIPIIILIFTVTLLGMGLFGYAVGWSMELIGSTLIYSALDVIPTQPFSKGDFPKLVAIVATLGGVPSMVGLGGALKDE